ncbi:MAG TPA: aromatic ring-hydroxylating dioxygenase subunit alpha [Stellaceae bacterium]|nr:aromatic ring-hydroxylating dioxygenase subunit alpha [Stellaceae bacterium]
MSDGSTQVLRDMWYYALPGKSLKSGRSIALTMLGETLLLGRTLEGAVFALRDNCPHRGVPLSRGRFDGHHIECCFHGWRFAPSGACVAIPALPAQEDIDLGRIRAKSYPVREIQGNIWVFFGDDPGSAPEVPVLPGIGAAGPQVVGSIRVTCGLDNAVASMVDPAHIPFVHTGWWLRRRGAVRLKTKSFAPLPHGFVMLPHASSASLRIHRFLGGAPETTISFHLPSVRIEHMRVGTRHFVVLLVSTPLSGKEVELTYALYWTIPWLNPLTPLFRVGLKSFMHQDLRVLENQAAGLDHAAPPLFVGEVDTQSKWYFRLKNEYARSRAEARPFVNPVKETVLRWQS